MLSLSLVAFIKCLNDVPVKLLLDNDSNANWGDTLIKYLIYLRLFPFNLFESRHRHLRSFPISKIFFLLKMGSIISFIPLLKSSLFFKFKVFMKKLSDYKNWILDTTKTIKRLSDDL